jgi:WhiB family redox-sensing transcriptional regulator
VIVHTPRLAADQPEPLWRTDARCRQQNAGFFFAPGHLERKGDKDAREAAARSLCRSCPVQQQCLDYALVVQEPHGIWGGLNELERRRLLRKRAAAGAPAGVAARQPA